MLRCQERNSGRDWGTAAGYIPFRCLVSPLALVQELINVLGKCAVQVSVLVVKNHSDGYPETFSVFGTLCYWSNQHSIFEWTLRLDDYNTQLSFRNLKPRIETVLDY